MIRGQWHNHSTRRNFARRPQCRCTCTALCGLLYTYTWLSRNRCFAM